MGVNAMVARRFRRSDGVIGVGFFIQFAGLQQASISWPDGPAGRFVGEDLARLKIEDLGEISNPVPPDPWANSPGWNGKANPPPADSVEPESFGPEFVVESDQKASDAIEVLKVLDSIENIPLDEDPEAQELASGESPQESTAESSAESPAPESPAESPPKSEAEHIRDYLAANPEASNAQVIEHLATISVDVTSSQVAYQRKRLSKQ